MKKKFIVPIMALFAACLLVLTGCGGPSAEQLIREDLEAQFAEVKADNEEMIEAIESSAGENFDSLGIEPKEFMNTYLDGFAYTINEITVEDKTANANVTVTAKSMGVSTSRRFRARMSSSSRLARSFWRSPRASSPRKSTATLPTRRTTRAYGVPTRVPRVSSRTLL